MPTWEDTIMSDEQMRVVIRTAPAAPVMANFHAVAQAQAEISWNIAFKAGQTEEYKKWCKTCMNAGMLISKPEQLVDMYKAGIREVVEFIEKEELIKSLLYSIWQVQLNKWKKAQG